MTQPISASNIHSSPIVQFQQVTYSFPGQLSDSIRQLDFSLARGKILILLGESGCGKTTLLRLIHRFLLPTQGEVFIEGISTKDWDPIALRKKIGYVFQDVGLFPHYTIAENIGLPLELAGWPKKRRIHRVEELLTQIGLAPKTFGHRYPHELSGGQSQRVGVARALSTAPPLLLLDEPFGALDPLTRVALQDEFQSLIHRLGFTTIFVTHDLPEALRLGDMIGLLKEGQFCFFGPTNEFLASTDPYAQAYMDTLIPKSSSLRGRL